MPGWSERVWRSWIFVAIFAATLCSRASAAGIFASARISADAEATLDSDLEISVVVKPHVGDAWTRLARRVTGDAANWKAIAEANKLPETLTTSSKVRVPFAMLKPTLQRQALIALFPADQQKDGAWVHKVIGTGDIEGEPLWKIAEWFTGDGANYAQIREQNRMRRLSTRPGDSIRIPKELLSASLRDPADSGMASKNRSQEVADDSVKQPEEKKPSKRDAEVVVVEAVKPATTGAPELEYVREGERPYAVYRLKKGEAIYSSVVVRLTGRLYSHDVNDAIDQIVAFNSIGDIQRLPVGFPVKIPMELLTAEYRPSTDPKRVSLERSKRESAEHTKRVAARNLEGVQIIIDTGHGGRDVGTEHDGVWESTYVYDIGCRLKKVLEENSGARVWITTKSKSREYGVPDDDELDDLTDQSLLTNPPYDLSDPTVGVNLRWYLANSIFHRAMKKKIASGKVVFISLHADSLHPSVRGAMAYIPGERFVEGTNFSRSGSVYLARSEVKEQPSVSQTREEALAAEGVSTDLAGSIMAAFGRSGLKVHPYDPVRDSIVRDGKEWVPAVIRYNKIPARLLLEVCNLGNQEDRRLMTTKKYRQSVAKAIYRGVLDFYDGRAEQPDNETRVAAR